MVFFNIVSSRTFAFRFCRAILGFFFKYIYFRKFKCSGLENIPRDGSPIMIVSNHQNGLIDALNIVFALEEIHTCIFLARADIFGKKTAAKILSFAKILPIYRQRDGKDSLGKNEEIFDFAASMMQKNFCICLFPEGHHQEGHYMGSFKKGFARIAFLSAQKMNFEKNIKIIPSAMHYSEYRGFRKEITLCFGKGLDLENYYAEYKDNENKCLLNIASEMQSRVEAMLFNCPYSENYEAMDALRRLEASNKKEDCIDWAAKILELPKDEALQKANNALALSKQMENLGFDIESYKKARFKGLKALVQISGKFIYLAITAPLGLLALALEFIPIYFSNKISAKSAIKAKTQMLYTSFHLVLTLILNILVFFLYSLVALFLLLIFCRGFWWIAPLILLSFTLWQLLAGSYLNALTSFAKLCKAYLWRKKLKF